MIMIWIVLLWDINSLSHLLNNIPCDKISLMGFS